jgi:hypothetical protein
MEPGAGDLGESPGWKAEPVPVSNQSSPGEKGKRGRQDRLGT